MNQLNKLIEQYERENPGKKAAIYDGKEFGGFEPDFVLWLASRPTCGKEQRLFLDELESDKFIWKPYSSGIIANNNELHSPTNIFQVNFTADLQKVIKGE